MGKRRPSVATRKLASPHTMTPLTPWEPEVGDLKRYRHFDGPLTLDEIKAFVRDPAQVARHSFRPLLHFQKKWRRAPRRLRDGSLEKRGVKTRPIRYACRKDSYVYKHYRELLSQLYERRLQDLGLQSCVLAYRRIPVSASTPGCKSNIHFADDAFKAISKMGKCCAVAIDISGFFDSLNHERLKEHWQKLLNVDRLPDDHFAVFRSVTQYRYVDRDAAFVALGYSRFEDGVPRYAVDPKNIPTRLCTPAQYRDAIVAGGLVKRHTDKFGIPQGTPISDVLANLFLIDFDVAMQKYAVGRGGIYMRYCDDILLILPGDGRAARSACIFTTGKIKESGTELSINRDKTEVVCFTGKPDNRCYALAIKKGTTRKFRKSNNDGISYLGFRFDGSSVFLRNSTIANLRGKIARTCRAVAHQHINRHPGKDIIWLLSHLPIREVENRFLQVRDFEEAVEDANEQGKSAFSVMTFWSYVTNAQEVFGGRAAGLLRQLRSVDVQITSHLRKDVLRIYR